MRKCQVIKFPIKNFWFSQRVVYLNLVRLYHQIGRISELSADMNKLGDILLGRINEDLYNCVASYL
ncbi:MAG: hypothetical protein ACUVQP_12685 [Bacteroidales bacterium]